MEVVELWRCVERESGQKAKSERDEKRCGAPRRVGQSREQCAALGSERERGSHCMRSRCGQDLQDPPETRVYHIALEAVAENLHDAAVV